MKWNLLALSLSFLLVFPNAFGSNPDILVYSEFTPEWSSLLVSKLRTMVKNFGLKDPFYQRIENPLKLSQSAISEHLDSQTKELVTDFGRVIGMDLLNTETRVSVEGLEYKIDGFQARLNDSSNSFVPSAFNTNVEVADILLRADKLIFSLELRGNKGKTALSVEIINPEIRSSGDDMIGVVGSFQLIPRERDFGLLVENLNLEKLVKDLSENRTTVEFTYEDIRLPEVSIKVGNKKLTFDKKKISDILNSKHEQLKKILVTQLVSLLKGDYTQRLLTDFKSVSIPKHNWFEAAGIQTLLKFEKIQNSNQLLELEIQGGFCLDQDFSRLGEICLKNSQRALPKSRITPQMSTKSLSNARDMVKTRQANLLVSLSEDYVNKILYGTYQAGLWESIFKNAGIKLGPSKMAFRLEDRDKDYGSLYLDVIYPPTKLEKFLIGTKELRFPLKIKAGVRIKSQNNHAVIIVHLDQVDTSDDLLVNGRPELGFPSQISHLRFKKKILEAIRKETQALGGSDVLELVYPEFGGIKLEDVQFTSDGNGRMNALMREVSY